ncbi:class II aldolase/adducin family protein, partial [Bacillus subtilis]|uniref:class II aldolase/adducin family protein n=1 Tax=Bacillus subtilis TaxID=1423 RepID=UPI003306AEDC
MILTHHPVTFLLTPTTKHKPKHTLQHFLLVDQNRQPPQTAHSLKPSPQTLFHTHFYNKTNARCSLHVHT